MNVCPLPFPHEKIKVIHEQWELLLLLNDQLPSFILTEEKVDVFWIKVLECSEEDNEKPLLAELANFALFIIHHHYHPAVTTQ